TENNEPNVASLGESLQQPALHPRLHEKQAGRLPARTKSRHRDSRRHQLRSWRLPAPEPLRRGRRYASIWLPQRNRCGGYPATRMGTRHLRSPAMLARSPNRTSAKIIAAGLDSSRRRRAAGRREKRPSKSQRLLEVSPLEDRFLAAPRG